MAFNINIYPSSNITNMFENWLNGVAKKEKAPSQREFVLYYGPCGVCCQICV